MVLSFILPLSSFFYTSPSSAYIASHFLEKTCLPESILGFLLEWDMKTQGGLWATSLPDAETAGFLGGLALALGPRMGSEAKNHLEKGD